MNKKCQVFTPRDYVNKILDSVGYIHDLYGKKIMENSCGDGNILAEIVQRYIDDCKQKGMSRTKIKNGLGKDIYGVEIDPEQVNICVKRLDEIVKKNNILPVSWNVICEDYLRLEETVKYDYVVGNPPYITYSELKKEEQIFLKRQFVSCQKGKFDYCYAFLEKSLMSLSDKGRMAYLIPSSVFKTVFGEAIRSIMCDYLEIISDYTQEKVFDSALVKSSIVLLTKNNESSFLYVDESSGNRCRLKKKELGKKWIFKNNESIEYKRRFGDYFKVSHVVATLLNDVFVINDIKMNEIGNYIIGNYEIEKALVRDTATPKSFRTGKKEKIIFPYAYDKNHCLLRLTEATLKKQFPGAYAYLLSNKEMLLKRNSDKKAAWFEYGRSQALSNLDCEKYLVSTVFSSKIQLYHLNAECIPYAGMYIVPKDGNIDMSLEDGISLLKSDEFKEYLLQIGIHINGNSVRVTSKDIENYMF